MRGQDSRSGSLLSYVDLEQRVRSDHPLRTIPTLVNEALASLDGRFGEIYSEIGRPSIPCQPPKNKGRYEESRLVSLEDEDRDPDEKPAPGSRSVTFAVAPRGMMPRATWALADPELARTLISKMPTKADNGTMLAFSRALKRGLLLGPMAVDDAKVKAGQATPTRQGTAR